MAASPYGIWTSPITSDLVGGNSFAVSDRVVWSRTISTSGSIARIEAGRRSRSRLLQPAALRMRCGTRMAVRHDGAKRRL